MDREKPESLLGAFRVLDLTDEKGLFCGKILGDLGADVIKIERPGGDAVRNTGPYYQDEPDPEKSLYWFYTNLNKRSVTLDLEKDEGREIFRRLVRTADFVIESFDPGYLTGLGLGYEDLEKINPRIIMTSITPYGQTGPRKDFKHSDICGWAMGAMMNLCGDPDRAPIWTTHQANFHGGLQGAMGSMVAYYFREMTGEGQHVDVSIQQAIILTLTIAAEYWDILQVNTSRSGSFIPLARKNLPPLLMPQISRCKDGHVVLTLMVGASPVNRQSNDALVKLMDRDGMAEGLKDIDISSLSASTILQEEYDALLKPIKKWLLIKTKAELYEAAIKHSVLIAPVNNVGDILEDPHLRTRKYWAEVTHPELEDKILYPGAPVKLSECPWNVWRRPPLIGEHNKEIYGNELGFTPAQMETLKTDHVV